MPNVDGSAVAGIDRPPWNAPNTMYFNGGPALELRFSGRNLRRLAPMCVRA